ncbi:MAG TPA: farnesyl diphosphate synthase [Candidatus Binatia bacterium]|jgi:geranylgeranyl diphosphate synthase type II|nr:farnesyl diphosphate synthase [Candidatus Binatia bacterium]
MNSDRLNKFDLNAYLQRQSAAIDNALEQYLQQYSGESQTIFRAMRYAVFPGGKRIRPILVLATGELFGATQSSLLPLACAVELIHAYSLIHDDLPALDDDDLRRGKPTAHKVFGEGVALLAGDGLLTEAFHLMSGPDVTRRVPAELVLRLIRELSHAVGVVGLVGGQALDLEAENDPDVDLATVEWIHVRKTGALILASIRAGAQVAGAEPADLGRITRYGERLGLAFQIADDILDALGQTAAGEGAESARNEPKKATYPSVVGMPQARETLKELLQLCLDELTTYGAQAIALKAIARHIVARAIHGDGKTLGEEING